MRDTKALIGNIVATRRKELGMEQEQVCDYAEISKTTLSTVENGKANISIAKLAKLLDVLGLEIEIKTKEKF